MYVICICICTLFCLFVLCIHQQQHAYTSIMHASTTHIHFNDRYNTAAWLTFGTVQYCHLYQQFFFCGYPKPPLSVQGIWSEYNTVTGSVSHTELLTLLLGNWFWCNYCHRTWSWCNTVAKTILFIHRADTKLCRSTLALCGSANLTGSHTNHANPVKSRGAPLRGGNRVLFPVEGPPLEQRQLR